MPKVLRPQSMPRYLIIMFLFAIIITAGGGYVYYDIQKTIFKKQVYDELTAIADLKARQISNWKDERVGDGRVIFSTLATSSLVQQYLHNPEAPKIRRNLLLWMTALKESYGNNYTGVFLLDTQGVLRLSSEPKERRFTLEGSHLKRAIQAKEVFLSDFYQVGENKHISLDIVIPIIVAVNGDTRHIAVLCLRIDPQKFLYPLVQTWPTPSETAETLLVKRLGDEIVFLNELRHQKNTALSFRLPMTLKKLPASRALLGETRIMEGIDYRSVPVLATARQIADTPWVIVAKVDQEEIYAPLRTRARLVFLLIVLIITAIGLGVAYWWRRQNAFFFQQRFEAEQKFNVEMQETSKALETSETRYRRLFETAQDGIVILDFDTGAIIDVNPYLADLLGYNREYFLGKELWQIGLVQDVAANKASFQELQRKGYVRHEHLPLATKDGQYKHAEFVCNVYHVNGRDVIQCNIRDITERKHAEQEKDKLLNELKEALDKVKTLSGLLPICSNCKKIRNDQGYWNLIEEYIIEHSDAVFSHGICPDCAKKLYPNYPILE